MLNILYTYLLGKWPSGFDLQPAVWLRMLLDLLDVAALLYLNTCWYRMYTVHIYLLNRDNTYKSCNMGRRNVTCNTYRLCSWRKFAFVLYSHQKTSSNTSEQWSGTCGVFDVWRSMNPASSNFTFYSGRHHSLSQIHYMFSFLLCFTWLSQLYLELYC